MAPGIFPYANAALGVTFGASNFPFNWQAWLGTPGTLAAVFHGDPPPGVGLFVGRVGRRGALVAVRFPVGP